MILGWGAGTPPESFLTPPGRRKAAFAGGEFQGNSAGAASLFGSTGPLLSAGGGLVDRRKT
jgi:hypothetical protein